MMNTLKHNDWIRAYSFFAIIAVILGVYFLFTGNSGVWAMGGMFLIFLLLLVLELKVK